MLVGKTICTVCNFIYDDQSADGTTASFASLGEDWCCPDCGADKNMFQPCSCATFSVAIDSTASVASLVVDNPLRAKVFEDYGIDFCCGGKASLQESCAALGLSVEEVIGALNLADLSPVVEEAQDWQKSSLRALSEHIVLTYHRPLLEQLVQVSQLAGKVSRVHGSRHPEMRQLLGVFEKFKEQLELHMVREESVLFPAIAKMEAGGNVSFACGAGLEQPLAVMGREHDEAGEAMRLMRELTNNYTLPADGCSSFKLLLDGLAKIESEMHMHVHKENNILFPRALARAESLIAKS